jgi:hypothetical protein
MPFLVTSAAGVNGDGYGMLLESAFCRQGSTRFLAGLHSAVMAHSSCPLVSLQMGKATTPSSRLHGQKRNPTQLVFDPELSPLDLVVAPNGNILVSSEHPFASPNAVTSVREYGAADGQLIRVLSAGGSAEFRRPRGLRFGPNSTLYCVAQDEERLAENARCHPCQPTRFASRWRD